MQKRNQAEETVCLELTDIIKERIRLEPDGLLSFRDYMALCLYHPELGYYMKAGNKIGREGDFYTSSGLGGLLGESIAEWVSRTASVWAEAQVQLVEWGGGSGRLAAQLLDELQRLDPGLYRRMKVIVIEASPYHRSLQRVTLERHLSQVVFQSPEAWFQAAPWKQTIVLSNELPDAFPVYRLAFLSLGWMELCVGWDSGRSVFVERERPILRPELLEFIHKENLPKRIGQRFEANLDAYKWYCQVAESLASGSWIMTIDYGDTRKELHAEHRMNGTLLCYRKHRASDTPLENIGEQDITSHVNFSGLKEAGEAAGLETISFVTQKQFLIEQGLLTKLQEHDARDPFSPVARRNRSIRQLLLSDQMSELFKVFIQQKR